MHASQVRRQWGDNIRQQRKVRGLSQSDLADAVGVHQNAVSHWEHGEAWPTVEHQYAVAKALGVPHRLLFPMPSEVQ